MKSINYQLQTIFTLSPLHCITPLHLCRAAGRALASHQPALLPLHNLATNYQVLVYINCMYTWAQIIRCQPPPPLILALATINDKTNYLWGESSNFLEKLSLFGKDLTIPRHQKLDKISPEYYIQFTFIFLRSQKQTACGMWMKLKISSHKILSYCPFPESESFRCFCSQFFKAFSSLETQT